MLTCIWQKKKGVYLDVAHNERVMFADPDPHRQTNNKTTHKQKFWGDVCRQARTLGHEKGIVNKPSQLHKQQPLIP